VVVLNFGENTSFILSNNLAVKNNRSFTNDTIRNYLENLIYSQKDHQELIENLQMIGYYKIHIKKMIQLTKVEVGNWKDLDFNTQTYDKIIDIYKNITVFITIF
jgi:hypothetical protein